jgi:hypothetical protein
MNNNKYIKIIFEFNIISYKKFDLGNIKKFSPLEIFCSFYSDLIFHLSSTGFYFIILNNELNYYKDTDSTQNDVCLLDFFINSINDLNKSIKSENLTYFLDFLKNIYKININNIINEVDKFKNIENEFLTYQHLIERDIAFFICEHHYNDNINKIFPEFKTIVNLTNF